MSRQSRVGRVGVIVVLIVALFAAGFTRHIAEGMRTRATARVGSAALGESSSLAGMSSFALALMLGGLRGPLVMILWTSSENQKNEKNLEDFDTKVEWIRRLQPEFDTVHIFQIWNKAYNISVQMASLSNKYLTILDALDYAYSVDKERPDNINIQASIAQVYFDKLANSAEKHYYRRRVREETLPHPSKQKLNRNDPGWRRLEMDPMLDEQHNILPAYLKTRHDRPANLPAGAEFNDGSELQYLPKYQPFHYGISPFALAYNYYKKSQLFQLNDKQKHAQLSDLVVDSRPALSLKNWSEEEWERGRRTELEAFGKTVGFNAERYELEPPTAGIKLTDRGGTAQIAAALDAYAMAARLSRDARAEYAAHLARYNNNLNTYQSHIDGLAAQEHLVSGDHDFLAAAGATGDARQKFIDGAKKSYEAATRDYLLMIFKYYVDPEAAKAVFPADRYEMDKLPTEALLQTLTRLHQFIDQARQGMDQNREDREEYERYIDRAIQRLATLGE